MRSACSAGDRLLLIRVAGMPRRSRASTWSFIRAMSGLTTTVMPSMTMAGNW
jgi:hypothetical protein